MYGDLLKTASILFKLAQKYEEYRERIEELSKENPYPFNSWFDKDGRSYIDFSIDEEIKPDPAVELYIKYFYTITDYLGGYAKEIISGRNVKIGKAINNTEKKLTKMINSFNDLEEEKTKQIDTIKEQAAQVRKIFEESKVRKGGKASLKIVFSQNPHDVAKMSTDRSWESCMTLGSGQYHENIFCEVSNGGFVAYLVKVDDLDIEKPISRIHIRRFDNGEGASIAIPEETMYGEDIHEFYDDVKTWVNNKNESDPGLYEMKGGEYSDTFKNKEVVLPEGEQKILDWLQGENLPYRIKYSYWEVSDEYDSELEDAFGFEYSEENKYEKSFSTELAAKDYITHLNYSEQVGNENENIMKNSGLYETDDWGEFVNPDDEDKYYEFAAKRFLITEGVVDNTPELKEKVVEKISGGELKLSDEFIKSVKPYAFKHGTYVDLGNFINNYPKHITEEDLRSVSTSTLREVAKTMKGGKLKQIAEEELEQRALVTLSKAIRSKDFNKVYRDIDVLHFLGEYISPENSQLVVDEVMSFIETYVNSNLNNFQSLEDRAKSKVLDNFDSMVGMIRMIADFAKKKNIISPQIIKLYKLVLGNNLFRFNIRDDAHVLVELGKNATPLLPKLKELRDGYAKTITESPRIIPNYNPEKVRLNYYNYVIESIETGKDLSDKYTIYR